MPEAAQEKIGRKLLDYVEKLNALRADLEIDVRHLEAGESKEMDIDDLLRRARERHGQA